MPTFVFIFVFFYLTCLPLFAEDIKSKNPENMSLIIDTTKAICESVPIDGKSQSYNFSGKAKAGLNSLFEKFGDVDISGDASAEIIEYSNVLQKDLAGVISNTNDCRKYIFKTLSDKFIVAEGTREKNGSNLSRKINLKISDKVCPGFVKFNEYELKGEIKNAIDRVYHGKNDNIYVCLASGYFNENNLHGNGTTISVYSNFLLYNNADDYSKCEVIPDCSANHKVYTGYSRGENMKSAIKDISILIGNNIND